MKRTLLFSFYVVIFAAIAAYRPYLVLYYQSLSFTGAQIGLLVGLAPLITIVALPLLTGLADATNRHRLIHSLLLLVAITSTLLLPHLYTFIPMLVLVTVAIVLWGPVMRSHTARQW